MRLNNYVFPIVVMLLFLEKFEANVNVFSVFILFKAVDFPVQAFQPLI